MRQIFKISIIIIALQMLFIVSDADTKGNETVKQPPKFESDHFFNYQSEFEEFNNFEVRFKRFLDFWNIKGASVAVAKDGKLIYSKGFGHANIEKNEPVEPFHLFRVASISKLITATAIMKLVEKGELALDNHVFGSEGILNFAPYTDYRDKKIEEITVRHLLEHSGGWTTRYGDPLFEQRHLAKRYGYKVPLSSEDIISIMLKKRLHFHPGQASYYSNLGFVILGKVIEAKSDLSYELFVQTEILFPLGIFDMRLGKNTRTDKAPIEVNYYEQPDALKIPDSNGSGKLVAKSNGGNNLNALEAAGGWIASATDIMKLLLTIDGFGYPTDILADELIQEMTTPKASGFAPLGWRSTNRYGQWIRTGSFAGSSAVLKRRSDGISFVILCNSSAWIGPDYPFKAASFTDRELNRIKALPEKNLLEKGPSIIVATKN